MGQQVLPPGFRFHPTDQELVWHYLKNKVLSGKCEEGVIGEIDLYKFEPWDLPEKSVLHSCDPEWYFFNGRDKKYPHGSRTNRATGAGFWKATGKDRKVTSAGGRMVGMKKTLVFYIGRAPNGERTDWIMHEYRLDEEIERKLKNVCCFVLCRVRKKNGLGPRNGDQYGAAILDEDDEIVSPTADIIPNVGNCKLPALCENETPQECLDTARSGFLESSSHAPTHGDCEGIEGSSTGEQLESFLQSLLSYDSQDVDGSIEPETHFMSNSFSYQGPGEMQMISADRFTALPEGGSLNFIDDTGSFEAAQLPTTETLSEMPSLMDLCVYGLDRLHDFLHPAPIEAEILGEMFETIGDDQGKTLSVTDDCIDQKVADETDPIGDDYFELAEMNYPLDEIFGSQPLREMDGSSQNFERITDDRYILQQPQTFDPEHGFSPSSEVPILTSGDIKEVSNVKLQCAVNLYRSHNGDGTLVAMSSGFDVQLVSQSLDLQSTVPCINSNALSLLEQPSLDAVPNCENKPPQLLRAESSSVTESLADDGDVLASMKSLSTGQPSNVLQGNAATRLGGTSSGKLSTKDAFESPTLSSQPNDSKVKGVASVPSSSKVSPSSSAPSPQMPKFLLKILHLLGDTPILPASAAELPIGQRPVKVVDSDTSASEHVARFGSKTSTVGFASGSSTCHYCSKVEADELRAANHGYSSMMTPAEFIQRASPKLSEGAQHLEGTPVIRCRCYLNTSSTNRIWKHRESLTRITPLTDHGQVWKKLFNGLTVFFFWGTTSVLIFFCLIRGFCRLTKSALTVF